MSYSCVRGFAWVLLQTTGNDTNVVPLTCVYVLWKMHNEHGTVFLLFYSGKSLWATTRHFSCVGISRKTQGKNSCCRSFDPRPHPKLKEATTLQSMMNAKLSKQRFWHCYKNGLIRTIQTITHNLKVSVKSASLY